jgi:hypothetical protein
LRVFVTFEHACLFDSKKAQKNADLIFKKRAKPLQFSGSLIDPIEARDRSDIFCRAPGITSITFHLFFITCIGESQNSLAGVISQLLFEFRAQILLAETSFDKSFVRFT